MEIIQLPLIYNRFSGKKIYYNFGCIKYGVGENNLKIVITILYQLEKRDNIMVLEGKYEFHRIFKVNTGLEIMKYRRITSSCECGKVR